MGKKNRTRVLSLKASSEILSPESLGNEKDGALSPILSMLPSLNLVRGPLSVVRRLSPAVCMHETRNSKLAHWAANFEFRFSTLATDHGQRTTDH